MVTGLQNHLGAECAKDLRTELYVRIPLGAAASFQNTTTLDNGYLGSRIDEERSEMRYLV